MCKHKPMQTPSGHCRCKKTQTPSRHEPKTAQTASQKTVSHYLWNNLWSHRAHGIQPIKQSLEPQSTCANTSLCKHHLDTADAKRPKHHLDTSRKPPKPQAKKLFHITFGIHIKQSLEPQSTWSPALCKHKPMQTPSGHCRCKKTQTPSRHEPKTAQTASQKTVSHHLWNPHKTIFGATEHMCKHKPMQTPSGHCRCKKTQTPSRHDYLWNPHKTENRPNRKPKNCFTLPLEST